MPTFHVEITAVEKGRYCEGFPAGAIDSHKRVVVIALSRIPSRHFKKYETSLQIYESGVRIEVILIGPHFLPGLSLSSDGKEKQA